LSKRFFSLVDRHLSSNRFAVLRRFFESQSALLIVRVTQELHN
jgi:hypothetical protein